MRKEKPDFPFMYLMSSTFERKTNDDVGIGSMARGARNFQKNVSGRRSSIIGITRISLILLLISSKNSKKRKLSEYNNISHTHTHTL